MKVVFLNYDKNWVPVVDEEEYGEHSGDITTYFIWFLANGFTARIDKERYCALVTNNRQMLVYYDHETKLFQSGT